MRLLIVSPWHPYPADNGSRLRAWNLIQRLAKHHDLRLVVGRQDDAPAELPEALRLICPTTRVAPWIWHRPGSTGLRGALRALLARAPRSVLETANPAFVAAIQAELSQHPNAVLAMELGSDAYLPQALPCPVILDQVEVSGLEQAWQRAVAPKERLARWLTYYKGQRYWRERFTRYSALTTVSAEEAQAVQNVLGESQPEVQVVPNGVAVKDYPSRRGEGIPGRLIYTGALSYAPNRDAVLWFVEKILPRITAQLPEVHLVVTGRADTIPAPLHSHPQVVFTGFVPDLRPVLSEAQVCVVPLRSGGGTRLKILEAWAAGLPVVSTRTGALGLEGSRSGEHLLLADSEEELAQSVLTLLHCPAQRQRLAQQAHALVASHYDWDTITQTLDQLLTRKAA